MGLRPHTIIKTKVSVFLQPLLFSKSLLSSHCDENEFWVGGVGAVEAGSLLLPWKVEGLVPVCCFRCFVFILLEPE